MSDATNKPQDDPIRHVVHLILENRSFDQMLGCMKSVYPDLDGVDPSALHSNADVAGKLFKQAPVTVRQMLKWDPHHEVPRVAVQLENHNSGFVKDFSQQYPNSTDEARQFIMGYYSLDFLPALHHLARRYTVCDRWFSSLPGPTWPNRFFALTGTSNGRVNMPGDGAHGSDLAGYFQQSQTTLFDRLNESAVHWKVYFHDIPQTSVLDNQRQPHNMARYFYIDEFYKDARGVEQEFPQYCLIEPDFMGRGQNDDHPPHDIMRAEKLVADVYNAIRSNDDLWKSTLLIVMFDEHGGFFDHVEPPATITPDDARPSEYSFDRLGVRVPAILVSPWTGAKVDHTLFDHTSVLKYLSEKWKLGPLGRRTTSANSIGGALLDKARVLEPDKIQLSIEQLNPPDPIAEEEAFGSISSNQAALNQLATWLEMDALKNIPRFNSSSARVLERIRKVIDGWLAKLFEEPTEFPVTLARPDKLALPVQATASDKVVKYMMRVKRYAAAGIRNRLDDSTLTADQQQHSLHTLSLLTGRNFHRESIEQRVQTARGWLKKGS